ncbi:hypothetical protein E2562_001062 [Oryza meyeriana var. granulata]|uniref:Uncharacterized protein n=1 Tax=Oryza meyeriana var. granulata TaxID=110450 RepID=A0A6G1EE04_9ORYZ|nr:hypothetical protein E2562_001062 [Oryza meyeriana var. granulata]
MRRGLRIDGRVDGRGEGEAPVQRCRVLIVAATEDELDAHEDGECRMHQRGDDGVEGAALEGGLLEVLHLLLLGEYQLLLLFRHRDLAHRQATVMASASASTALEELPESVLGLGQFLHGSPERGGGGDLLVHLVFPRVHLLPCGHPLVRVAASVGKLREGVPELAEERIRAVRG